MLRDAIVPAAQDWSYVLVTPDGVIGGALDGVISRLRQHGFIPGASLLVDLSVEAMQHVYREPSWHISNPGYADVTFSWDMHGELYGLAPACLVMLFRPTAQACAAMLRCKGHTRPELSAPDTIRWSGENVIFNLVHCPDDPSSALRELAVLVGADSAARLGTVVRSDDPDLRGLLGVEALVGCLPAFSGWEAISFAAIANKLRRRVAQHLALAMHDNPDVLDILMAAQRRLVAEYSAITASPTSGARLELGRRTSPAVHASLAAAARHHGDEVVLGALGALAELYRLDGARNIENILAVSTRGVHFSQLERVILESHSYAFRPGRETLRIYSVDAPLVIS